MYSFIHLGTWNGNGGRRNNFHDLFNPPGDSRLRTREPPARENGTADIFYIPSGSRWAIQEERVCESLQQLPLHFTVLIDTYQVATCIPYLFYFSFGEKEEKRRKKIIIISVSLFILSLILSQYFQSFVGKYILLLMKKLYHRRLFNDIAIHRYEYKKFVLFFLFLSLWLINC